MASDCSSNRLTRGVETPTEEVIQRVCLVQVRVVWHVAWRAIMFQRPTMRIVLTENFDSFPELFDILRVQIVKIFLLSLS